MYILQEPLYSFEELTKYQPCTRLEMIFSHLDLTPCLSKLPPPSNCGPKGYSRGALLRGLLAMPLLSIPTFTALVERLNDDLRFRFSCGFPLENPVPSISTFSRFYRDLAASDGMEAWFHATVRECRELQIIRTETVAIDSSSIQGYEHPVGKKSESAQPPEPAPEAQGNPAQESHASWGFKKDSRGNDYWWYGYKLHLATDVDSGLPVACSVTPANHADSAEAIPLMERMGYRADYYCLDKGYDAEAIYRKALELGGQAIIPLNKRNEKQPPEGYGSDRTPVCSMGHPMVYWGMDKKRGCLKFRCPHICGKVDCAQGSHWCSPSNYGCVAKKYVKEDPRNLSLPHRGSKNWKSLYRKRGAVERSFSVLKERMGAEVLYVRGTAKVTTHLLLCCMAVFGAALAVLAN